MPRPFASELRNCLRGALKPALTTVKNPSRSSRHQGLVAYIEADHARCHLGRREKGARRDVEEVARLGVDLHRDAEDAEVARLGADARATSRCSMTTIHCGGCAASRKWRTIAAPTL